MEEVLTGEDLRDILNSFVRKSIREHFARPEVVYESAGFRHPELYGLPVFIIGDGRRFVSYAGQYIQHKEIRERIGSREIVKWRIITGFVRIVAKHMENDIWVELMVNGAPACGVRQYLEAKEQYAILEDVYPIQEIECSVDAIVNLTNVMNLEDSAILIDKTGLLREIPIDLVTKYGELKSLVEFFQKQLSEQEMIISDQKTQIAILDAENRRLVAQFNNLLNRIQATAGIIHQYKYELLKIHELMNAIDRKLEAVKKGKETLQAVMSDWYDLYERFETMSKELKDKFEELEETVEKFESVVNDVKKKREELEKKEKG